MAIVIGIKVKANYKGIVITGKVVGVAVVANGKEREFAIDFYKKDHTAEEWKIISPPNGNSKMLILPEKDLTEIE